MKHTERLRFVGDHKGEPSHLPFSLYPEGDPFTEVARCAQGYPKLFAAAPEMAALLREKYERERWWATDGSGVAWAEKVHALLAELEEHE